MTTHNRPMALAVSALLFAMATPAAMAGTTADLSVAAQPGGFLTQSLQRAPSTTSGTLSAGLPHLRFEITLTQMEHTVIAGSGGVVSHGYPIASVKIASNAADVSIPSAAGPAIEFPTPPSDRVWNLADNAVFAASVNPLFVGIIENGCLGAPAMFDLSLDSSIADPDKDGVIGAVHLADAVYGPGNYNVEYTVRASEADGDVSDITFRGHARAYCTGQLGNLVATDWAKIIGSSSSFGSTRGTAEADSITCRPGDSNWCANGFQIQCERQSGGLSSEPDGGVTCTYPGNEDAPTLTTAELVPPAPDLSSFQSTRQQTAGWVSLTCHGENCEAFAQRCEARGGGLSTEPDGGITCTGRDNTCSGCD